MGTTTFLNVHVLPVVRERDRDAVLEFHFEHPDHRNQHVSIGLTMCGAVVRWRRATE
jgi:hypothetical protein